MIKKKRNRLYRMISLFLERRFNLHVDKADEQTVITELRRNTEFKGANLWTLIFAIFIASIGLNVNATAVIIGAMLISPLMGPIMGIGLAIGITDFELLKKGGRNLLIATVISIATSSIYFWLTPLHEAQSELLSRTTPSLWDVFIALLGGLAGVVAATRKEQCNSGGGHCNRFNAASLHCRIRYRLWEYLLFSRRPLSLLYQQCVYLPEYIPDRTVPQIP